jgi:hypothetical protein
MKPVRISVGVLACACFAFAVVFESNGLHGFALSAVIEGLCTLGLALVLKYPTR